MSVLRALLVVAGLAWASAAYSAEDDRVFVPSAAGTSSTSAGGSAGLGSMSLTLGVALAAVGGWMVWRNRRGTPVGRDSRALAIEETRSLGNRQYLVVASYEGKKFLIGVCPGRIDLVSPLDGAAARDSARE